MGYCIPAYSLVYDVRIEVFCELVVVTEDFSELLLVPSLRFKFFELVLEVSVIVHQCMAGLRGPRSGLLIKKPTDFCASDEALIKYLHGLTCNGRHQHAQLDAREPGGPADKAKDAARWPMPLCHRVAKGSEEVLRRVGEAGLMTLPMARPGLPQQGK